MCPSSSTFHSVNCPPHSLFLIPCHHPLFSRTTQLNDTFETCRGPRPGTTRETAAAFKRREGEAKRAIPRRLGGLVTGNLAFIK
ncbi:hypothetical protein L596_005561 [Steinernema carpocapsae]|uniref:Uncharacterized protein n=1 Tax=Steinernema carpocapsae TaxID=34508 RepID=A0A4U8V0Z0_STECR|nr:hypothetical protein L596_005561 [Steinernema carpocapsae]